MFKGSKFLSVYKGIPIYEEDKGLVIGQLASHLLPDENVPEAEWTGGKIPVGLVRQCVAFSLSCFNLYGGEVQGRLYYERNSGRWVTVIVKQFVSRSLESQEDNAPGNIDEALAKLPEGNWVQMGTWHSHAGANAYQSSIDFKDEIDQNGIHFTVGSMDKEEFDIHTRIVHNGLCYDLGKGLDNCALADGSVSMTDLPVFDQSWHEMLVERPPVVVPERPATVVTPYPTGSRKDYPKITDIQFEMFKGLAAQLFTDSFTDVALELYQMSLSQDFAERESIMQTDMFEGPTVCYCFLCGEQTTDIDGVCPSCANDSQI